MNIVILSRNPYLYSTQSISRAARQRGHHVRVLDHILCDLVIEKSKHSIYYEGRKLTNIDAVIPRIGDSVTGYGSSVIRQFEAMRIFSTLSSDSLLKCRNKITTLQLLSSQGIDIPKSSIGNNPDSYEELIESMYPMPVILKLVQGTHGLGVIKAHNKKIAKSILEGFYKTKNKMIIQKYIPESNGADIRVFIIDKQVVAAMKRQARPGEFRSNLHRGGEASAINLSLDEKQIALNACEILKLQVAGVDILQSSNGPKILEVNASPGLEGIESTTRVDVAKRIITFVERNYKKLQC